MLLGLGVGFVLLGELSVYVGLEGFVFESSKLANILDGWSGWGN